jgi:CMP-N-acetylneuraminic acid synthetase
MSLVALICARGGSKGVAAKNIRYIGGKPLIVWTIEQALEFKKFSRVIVSTDSAEIAAIALSAGAEIPFIRPEELAQDNSPEWQVWQHALQHIQNKFVSLPAALVVLPTTSPLRALSDIQKCVDLFFEGNFDIVITATKARRSPYFNMVKVREDGMASLADETYSGLYRRQDAPELFDMTTVAYVANPTFVMNSKGMFEGRVGLVQIPEERAMDIDTVYDFDVAEFLISRKEDK